MATNTGRAKPKRNFHYLFYRRCIECLRAICLSYTRMLYRIQFNVFQCLHNSVSNYSLLHCVPNSVRLHTFTSYASAYPHQLVYQSRRFVYLNDSAEGLAGWLAAIAYVLTCALGLYSLTFDGGFIHRWL